MLGPLCVRRVMHLVSFPGGNLKDKGGVSDCPSLFYRR